MVDEDELPALTVVIRGKEWNTWGRGTDENQKSPTGPSNSVDLDKFCLYHKVKEHDTKESRTRPSNLPNEGRKLPKVRVRTRRKWAKIPKAISNRRNASPAMTKQHLVPETTLLQMRRNQGIGNNFTLSRPNKKHSLMRSLSPMICETSLNENKQNRAAAREKKLISESQSTIPNPSNWEPPKSTHYHKEAIGVHTPHNNPLLVEIKIERGEVVKFLINIGFSVDLIFHDILDKMEDMKPSTRSLTGFNGETEENDRHNSSSVYAGGITFSVKFSIKFSVKFSIKFSVIKSKALNSIDPPDEGHPPLPPTYHQCIKFPYIDIRICTIQGDQQAARDLLVTTVKLQRTTSHIYSVSKPIHKIYPQNEKGVEVVFDKRGLSKIVGVGAYLADNMKDNIISFLKKNALTFTWTTSDMRGIDLAVTAHEHNVGPTQKLGPKRSKAVNDKVDHLRRVGSITEWLANPVVVKKKNSKWRVCVDFTDLNKACLKDSFPLPHTD
ncbi:hypothetical protein N665_0087s0004 [Sinapis alba]|nr:hypothetical protein N665_0087s0004 [Sinapis alba]